MKLAPIAALSIALVGGLAGGAVVLSGGSKGDSVPLPQ